MNISRDMVEREIVTEDAVHVFTAFASDLEIVPGKWPSQIETSLGNGHPFMFTRQKERDGDLLSRTYRQSLGCIELIIFND